MRKYDKLLNMKSKHYTRNVIFFFLNSVAILLLIVFLVLSYTVFSNVVVDSIRSIPSMILGFLFPLEKICYDNVRDSQPWQSYLRFALRKKDITKDTDIRISYAAFIVIEINGKYLLKQNTHGFGLFTLPGRTYRLSSEKKAELQEKFDVKPDPVIDKDYQDYRLLVKAKHIKGFYKQFLEDVKPREFDYSPILKEIATNLNLNEDFFENANLKFAGRRINPISYSRYTNFHEMILADKLMLYLKDEQLKALTERLEEPQDKYVLRTLDVIKANGVNKQAGQMKADIATNVYDIISMEMRI